MCVLSLKEVKSDLSGSYSPGHNLIILENSAHSLFL